MNLKLKRALSLTLTLIMMLNICLFTSFDSFAGNGVSSKLQSLRSKFPNGKYWNHQVSSSYPDADTLMATWNECTQDITTSSTCATHNGKASNGQIDCNYFDGGIQCCGFARKIFYDIFGQRATNNSHRTDKENLMPGDYVCLWNGGHYAVVLSADSSGFTCVECNLSGANGNEYPNLRCQIRWDHWYSKSDISYFVHAGNYKEIDDPHTHSYGSWTTTKEATCTAAGTKKRTCSCGHAETGTIAALGHNYSSWVTTKAATCTEAGVQTKTCSRCNDKQTQAIVKTGHNYTSVTTPATCTTGAYITYTCSLCNDTYKEPTNFTEWSETKPVGVPDDKIQTQIQYSYSDYDTKESTATSMTGYSIVNSTWKQTDSGTIKYVPSWPSGFEAQSSHYKLYAKSPKATSETSTKRVTATTSTAGYLYWHWCKNQTGGPLNRWISDCYEDDFWMWHCYESTTNYTSNYASDGSFSGASGTYYAPNGDCCAGAYWYLKTEIKQQNWKEETKYNTFARWTDDSAWSATPVTESSTRRVKTRTVYRTEVTASHNYVYGVCTVCGDKKYDAKSAEIKVANVSGKAGDTVTVPVSINNNPGFAGFTFDIQYPSSFELTKISKGQLLKEEDYGALTPNASGNKVTWVSPVNTTGDGELLTLTFKVNSSNTGDIILKLTDNEETNFVDADGVSIRPVFVAGNIDNVTHNFSSKTTTSAYLKSAATCTSPAVYYYKCVDCDEKGTETYTNGSALGHTESAWIIDKAATTTAAGSKHIECTVCHTTIRTATIPKITATDSKLVIESKKAKAGDEIEVSVSLEKNPGIAGLQISLNYDTNILTLKNSKNGSLFSGFTAGKNFVWDDSSNVTADGKIATFTFIVANSAAAGEYEISVIVRSCTNEAFDDVELAVENGVVTVVDFTYGDANDDDEINMKDVVILRQYLANYDYDTNTSTVTIGAGADANGDGAINMKDVVILRQYLANFDYDTNTSTVVLGPQ